MVVRTKKTSNKEAKVALNRKVIQSKSTRVLLPNNSIGKFATREATKKSSEMNQATRRSNSRRIVVKAASNKKIAMNENKQKSTLKWKPKLMKVIKKKFPGKTHIFMKRKSNKTVPADPAKAANHGKDKRRAGFKTHPAIPEQPRNENKLAAKLIEVERKFTRKFIKSTHQAWLDKNRPGQMRKIFLIDVMNQLLTQGREKDLKTRPLEQDLSQPTAGHKRDPKPQTQLHRPVSKPGEPDKKQQFESELEAIVRNPWQFVSDGGCLGFNLIKSDEEGQRRPIKRPLNRKRVEKQQAPEARAPSSDRSSSLCSYRSIERKKQLPSSASFQRELKAYLKRIHGKTPFTFNNLGRVIITPGESHPAEKHQPISPQTSAQALNPPRQPTQRLKPFRWHPPHQHHKKRKPQLLPFPEARPPRLSVLEASDSSAAIPKPRQRPVQEIRAPRGRPPFKNLQKVSEYRSQKEAFARFREERQKASSELEALVSRSKSQSLDNLKKIIPRKRFKEDLDSLGLDARREPSALQKRPQPPAPSAEDLGALALASSPRKRPACELPATKENTGASLAKDRSGAKPADRSLLTSPKKQQVLREDPPSQPGSAYRILEASAARQPLPAEPVSREPLNVLFEKADPRFKASVEKAASKTDYRELALKSRLGLAADPRPKPSESKQPSAKASAAKGLAAAADLLMDKSPPLRRFEHLLQPADRLPLPHSFAQLLHKFENLDSILNFFALKDTLATLASLQRAFVNSLRQ